MSIQRGDTVRVITKNTAHFGKIGTVVHVYEDEKTCNVEIKEKAPDASGFEYMGLITGFFLRELEIVLGGDEEDQIFKIAAALHTEVRNADWTWEQAKENAASLYRAGMRHHG